MPSGAHILPCRMVHRPAATDGAHGGAGRPRRRTARCRAGQHPCVVVDPARGRPPARSRGGRAYVPPLSKLPCQCGALYTARAAAGRCHSAWWPQWQCPGCSVRGCRIGRGGLAFNRRSPSLPQAVCWPHCSSRAPAALSGARPLAFNDKSISSRLSFKATFRKLPLCQRAWLCRSLAASPLSPCLQSARSPGHRPCSRHAQSS
jgi:hypothetical protein